MDYEPAMLFPVVCAVALFGDLFFIFCEIFIKLQMCYNLISGHVLCDFQMATVTTAQNNNWKKG